MYCKTGPATLSAYAANYNLLRDVRPETVRQYEITARLFEQWAGGPVQLVELDEASVSAWLRDYAASGVVPETVRSKKVGILALWRAAADEGLCEPPTRRIRSVRVPYKAPTCWTWEEVSALLTACQGLQRWHKTGLRRSAWFDLAVRLAWDTGLRQGDQWRLPVADIRPDGAVHLVQSKTGRPVICQVSTSTAEALRVSLELAPRQLVTPWMSSHETFDDQFKRLTQKAGIRQGTWKWLRRASATDVEIQRPGSATAHLGHVPGSRIAERSYIDPAQFSRIATTPRELLVSSLLLGGGGGRNPLGPAASPDHAADRPAA
jgi:integrase